MQVEKEGKVDGKRGKWVFFEEDDKEAQERKEDMVMDRLFVFRGNMDFQSRCAALEQFHDYFPGENEVPPDGAWVLVKRPPHTEFTVPPLSIWFATPWPHNFKGPNHRTRRSERDYQMPEMQRVKIVTPRGDLGLYPHEYSLIKDVAKYYEFFGEGMKIRFFGSNTDGVPELPLFYLRSRGVGKAEAISMLIGQIKAHGVCWIEAQRELTEQFGLEWADDSRLATVTTRVNS